MARNRAGVARIARAHARVRSPLEGFTGPPVGVDKNPTTRQDRERPPLAGLTHGELPLLLRRVKAYGGPLRSPEGSLQRTLRSQGRAGLRNGAQAR